jgi:hypothetical protein
VRDGLVNAGIRIKNKTYDLFWLGNRRPGLVYFCHLHHYPCLTYHGQRSPSELPGGLNFYL